MSLRQPLSALAAATTAACLAALSPAVPAAATSRPLRTVTYAGVSLQVPASWPVVNLARHPRACPRLDVHAVYLGTQGPAAPGPACPATLRGKTAAVAIQAISRTSPDLRQATRAVVIGGRAARTNPDAAVTHTIIDIVPSAGLEISLSYGRSAAPARLIEESIAVTGAARPARAAKPAAIRSSLPQGVVRGPGFDTCAAPSASAMHAWLSSRYRAVGIYIGGVNRACAQANLTSAWIRAIQAQGWHYFPLYVGLQASCVAGFGDASIKPGSAAAEGRAAADDAITQAGDLGIPAGTPIIYDMEAYRGGCGVAVTTFLSAWDAELHARGYVAGVYESFSNVSDLIAAAGQITEPDVIHYADWDGHATTTSSYMPAGRWTGHHRIHQYLGGHNETHGGVTINIDDDQLDVALSGAAARSTVTPLFKIAVAINSNGSAEWFARAANGKVRHNYQHPVGSSSWSATRAVGNSPANLVSNPAVTSDSDGILTLFARTSANRITHAWQQAGAPNEWRWGGAAGAGALPGTPTGDPAAARAADGTVRLFVSLATGAVATTRQAAPGDDTGWTAWTSLGGTCGSSPVAAVNSAKTLEVFCTTRAGGLAVNGAAAGSWSGWHVIGGAPGRLTGAPSVVSAAGGPTEVFTASRSGTMAYAWRNPGGSWAWGSSPSGGARIMRGPSATTWPGGKVGVLGRQANGQLGFAVQQGAGAAGWGGWTQVGIRMRGTPAAWTNTNGNPEAAVLTSGRRIAVSTYSGGAWSTWTRLGAGY